MRADHIALVFRKQIAICAFVDEHVEVIEPEVRHHFVELSLAVNRAQQFRLSQFTDNHALRVVDRHQRLALLR